MSKVCQLSIMGWRGRRQSHYRAELGGRDGVGVGWQTDYDHEHSDNRSHQREAFLMFVVVEITCDCGLRFQPKIWFSFDVFLTSNSDLS